jgi:hydrogenase-4 component B
MPAATSRPAAPAVLALAIACVACAAGWCAWSGLAGGASLGTLAGPMPALALELGTTPLAAPFCALLAILSVAVAIWSLRRGSARDVALIAVFSAAMLLVLLARSVAAFFFAWEAMSLSSALLVASHHERRDVRRATFSYLLVAQAGALCVLAALWLVAAHAGSASFDAIARGAGALPADVRAAAFALALAGFGSKAGLVPLHFWLPRAHPVAPAAASALLSGAMLKVALFGLALVGLSLAAPGPAWWGIALIVLGSISAVAGVVYAVVDRDLKRLLAYSSVENVGIIVIALGVALLARAAGNPLVGGLALTAALLHAFNHALFKGLLFLGAGAVLEREGTVDLERLGGLWDHLVWTAPCVLVGCAAIAGLPPFNGFVSEWLTFQSLVAALAAWHADPLLAIVLAGSIAGLALTGGLAAATFVKVFGIGFLGKPRRAADVPVARETFDAPALALVVLALACAGFGVAPMLVVTPLSAIAAAVFGTTPGALAVATASVAALPLALLALPLAGAVACVALARARGLRRVATWTCGSPVTAAAQYTATAFAKPLRTIFAFVLIPERRRRTEGGRSRWFPERIVYRTESRYLIDEFARVLTAGTLRAARRSRALQSGSLRLYLTYAVGALILVVVVSR